MKPTLKEIIWEAHPYKTRLEKLRLLKYLPEAFKKVTEAASLLGISIPPTYDVSLCDITDDYLVIRDSTRLLAKCYIGDDASLRGHIILSDGHELTEHSYHKLTGKTPTEYGYISGCSCLDCQKAVLSEQAQMDEDRLKRYEERACIIGLKPEEKIRTVSERLQDLVDAPINIPLTIMTKITTTTHDQQLRQTE